MPEKRMDPETERRKGPVTESTVPPILVSTTPPILTSTPRRMEEQEATELRRHYAHLTRVVGTEVTDHARALAAAQGQPITRRDLEAEEQGLRRALDSSGIANIQIPEGNVGGVVSGILRLVERGRELRREGRYAEAHQQFHRVREQLQALVDTVGTELNFMVNGVPISINVEGMTPRQAVREIFRALETVVSDAGTENHERYEFVRDTTREITQNPDVRGSPHARGLIGRIIERIRRRAQQARDGEGYTPQHRREDQQELGAIRREILMIREILSDNFRTLSQMQSSLQMRGRERTEEIGRRLQDFEREINDMIERTRSSGKISPDEMRMAMARYRSIMGRSPNEQEALLEAATGLRGTARTVRDGTAEWFGEQALTALRAGNIDIAALAVGVGMLERLAMPHGARNELTSYWRIHDIIREQSPVTADMIARFSTQIEIASRFIINRNQQE